MNIYSTHSLTELNQVLAKKENDLSLYLINGPKEAVATPGLNKETVYKKIKYMKNDIDCIKKEIAAKKKASNKL